MILYSLCVALKGNEYLQMLLYLVKTLLKTGSFDPKRDHYYVMADQETATALGKIGFAAPLRVMVVPKPTSTYECMKLKYLFPKMIPDPTALGSETFVYLDADLLSLRPFYAALPPDTIAVVPEGAPTDTNYCGRVERPLSTPYGVTAGFFLYRWGIRVQGFFDTVLLDLEERTERFYTLDQVAFNRYLPSAPFQPLNPEILSFNGQGLSERTLFLNYAGEPGDGPFHLAKGLDFFLRVI